MSRWLDAFKQHPFQNILLQFNNQLSSFKLEKDMDAATVSEYSRIRKVIKYNSLNVAGSEVETLKNELKNIQNQIQTILAEFNTQFQNSQSALQQRADTAIDSANKKFASQVETIDKRVAVITQRSQGEFKGLLDRSQQKVNEEFVDLTTKATTILGILQRLQDDAEKVFGVVQNTAQAGAHKIYADTERKTANWYRYGAIFLMLSSVAVLIIPELLRFIHIENYAVEWVKILDRLPISLILFAPAFYLARESNKHKLVVWICINNNRTCLCKNMHSFSCRKIFSYGVKNRPFSHLDLLNIIIF